MSEKALELLRAQKSKHEESLKRLIAQHAGVERSISIEQGKLQAITEAITAIESSE